MSDNGRRLMEKGADIAKIGGAVTQLGCAVTQAVFLLGVLLLLGSCLLSFLFS